MARAIQSAISTATSAHGLRRLPNARIGTIALCLFQIFTPLVKAIPVVQRAVRVLEDEDLPKDANDPTLWIYLGTAIALVLLGGIFAGLTIALMGQDEIYLQVIATSGEGSERKNAARVLRLLKRGKHWVLVTLLLSNVITNETLPIVLDRSLGGGWPAVLASTILIVIFGEVVPQSICVRYGLPIGAWMSPCVQVLMWIMAPIAWPTAKLLDYLLGEDHGTTYKKAGLKTLVTLHKTLGASADERLNEDEVTIISAVLDLKAKPVGSIMTPMKQVFTMSADTVLDEKMMDTILSAGYSRIPIHTPNNPRNFVGMLLVKMLITYDPEDALRVRDFALATLPETRPETSCLDIINFFQEGKSHMVLVSEFPGEDYGAVGVVTLEDVIEELIGEEIIDESDVFIDVHKAIRRMAPAPRTRAPKGEVVTDNAHPTEVTLAKDLEASKRPTAEARKSSASEHSQSRNPSFSNLILRRRSSGNVERGPATHLDAEVREHLKHLGPSNAANKPKTTRINTVKIKPGMMVIPDTVPENGQLQPGGTVLLPTPAHQGGHGEGLLENAGREASDAVQAVAVNSGVVNYGTIGSQPGDHSSWKAESQNGRQRVTEDDPTSPKSIAIDEHTRLLADENARLISTHSSPQAERGRERRPSVSTLGSLHSRNSKSRSPPAKRHTARSGSISENIVDSNGVKKLVLETTSSSDSEDKVVLMTSKTNEVQVRPATGSSSNSNNKEEGDEGENEEEQDNKQNGGGGSSASKKKRKKRGKKGKRSGESTPLLGGN